MRSTLSGETLKVNIGKKAVDMVNQMQISEVAHGTKGKGAKSKYNRRL